MITFTWRRKRDVVRLSYFKNGQIVLLFKVLKAFRVMYLGSCFFSFSCVIFHFMFPNTHCSGAGLMHAFGLVHVWKTCFICIHKHMQYCVWKFDKPYQKSGHGIFTNADMYLWTRTWCGTEDWQDSTVWGNAGVSLCLSARPLIAAIWQFNLREAERSSRLVTSAGHYWARRQRIASAINDKGCSRGQSKKVKEKQSEVGVRKISGERGNGNVRMKGGERRDIAG